MHPDESPFPPPSRVEVRYDIYLLRNVVWCGSCDVPMAAGRQPRPGRGGEGQRTYDCPLRCEPVPARPLESRVISAVQRHTPIEHIAPEHLQSVLDTLLVVVKVGATLDDVEPVWRI